MSEKKEREHPGIEPINEWPKPSEVVIRGPEKTIGSIGGVNGNIVIGPLVTNKNKGSNSNDTNET